jgi:hypothetical protein
MPTRGNGKCFHFFPVDKHDRREPSGADISFVREGWFSVLGAKTAVGGGGSSPSSRSRCIYLRSAAISPRSAEISGSRSPERTASRPTKPDARLAVMHPDTARPQSEVGSRGAGSQQPAARTAVATLSSVWPINARMPNPEFQVRKLAGGGHATGALRISLCQAISLGPRMISSQ